MRFVSRAALAAVVVLLCVPAFAEQYVCFDGNAVVTTNRWLSTRGEERMLDLNITGALPDGTPAQLAINTRTGSFSILFKAPSGMACVLMVGVAKPSDPAHGL